MSKPPSKEKKQRNWAEKLTDGYSQGMSDVEVCKELNITLRTFNEMYSENDGFRKLVDYGRTLAHAWWMEQGRIHLRNRDFSTPLWTMNMKNRHGWAEKSEVKTSGEEKPLNLEDMKARIQKALPKLLEQYGGNIELLKKDIEDAEIIEYKDTTSDE